MNASLAGDKTVLIERSAQCRMRLGRETSDLRACLEWTRVATAVAAAPSVRRFALGVAFSAIGLGRMARFVAYAGRILLYARLVQSLIGYARGSKA